MSVIIAIDSCTFPSLNPPTTRDNTNKSKWEEKSQRSDDKTFPIYWDDNRIIESIESTADHGKQKNAFASESIGKFADCWSDDELHESK